MKRMAMGAVAGLTVWFGSALAAEAQQITPTGPMAIQAGSNNWNFTANLTLNPPLGYKMTTSLYKNGVYQTCFVQIVPNPGIVNSTFMQQCQTTFSVSAGDIITFKTTMLWNRQTIYGPDWNVTVTGTRPSSKTVQNKSLLAIQGVDRDRRRE